MTETAQPVQEFSDADLDRALKSCIIIILVLAVAALPFWWLWGGWQTAALFAVGALISAVGMWEWRSLVTAVSSRMDANPDRPPKAVGAVLVRFSLRLVFVAGLLYVSLRCLHGSAYALLAGLGLAVIAITLVALRLLRRWL